MTLLLVKLGALGAFVVRCSICVISVNLFILSAVEGRIVCLRVIRVNPRLNAFLFSALSAV